MELIVGRSNGRHEVQGERKRRALVVFLGLFRFQRGFWSGFCVCVCVCVCVIEERKINMIGNRKK